MQQTNMSSTFTVYFRDLYQGRAQVLLVLQKTWGKIFVYHYSFYSGISCMNKYWFSHSHCTNKDNVILFSRYSKYKLIFSKSYISFIHLNEQSSVTTIPTVGLGKVVCCQTHCASGFFSPVKKMDIMCGKLTVSVLPRIRYADPVAISGTSTCQHWL